MLVGKQQHRGSFFPMRIPSVSSPAPVLGARFACEASPLPEKPSPFLTLVWRIPVCTAPWWVNYERSSDSWYSDQSEQTLELFSVPQAYAVRSRQHCAEISVWRQGEKENANSPHLHLCSSLPLKTCCSLNELRSVDRIDQERDRGASVPLIKALHFE